MKSRLGCWLLTGFLVAGMVQAQETEPDPAEACPGSPRTDCDGVCSFDWRPYYEQVVRLTDRKLGQDFRTSR